MKGSRMKVKVWFVIVGIEGGGEESEDKQVLKVNLFFWDFRRKEEVPHRLHFSSVSVANF